MEILLIHIFTINAIYQLFGSVLAFNSCIRIEYPFILVAFS